MKIRIDPISGQPTLLATARSKRPHFSKKSHAAHQRKRGNNSKVENINPFAPGNEHITGPEVWADSDNPSRQPDAPDWKVRVVRNKYPITPQHEVIILSPHPKKDFSDLSLRQVRRIMMAFVQRSRAMESHGQSFLFGNHGPESGATVSHPHAQIMAFPTLPPVVHKEAIELQKLYEAEGDCLFCRMLTHEESIAARYVWSNDNYTILTPESSGWPHALTLMPKIHQASFSSVKDDQIADLAEAMQLLIKLYDTVLDKPAYNYWIHSAKGHFYHWHLDIVPRQKILAGVELGAGIMVNDRISPENAAKEFRLALKKIR